MSIVNYDPPILEAAVRYWQRVFRMQDWEISVLCVDKDVFASPDACADSTTDSRHRQAVIRVAERKELDAGFTFDYRVAMAHEFAHVLTWDMPRPGQDGTPHWLFEQTINTIGIGIAAMTPWDTLFEGGRTCSYQT